MAASTAARGRGAGSLVGILVGKFRPTHAFAQRAPLRVAGAGGRHPAIGAAVRVDRRAARVGVAGTQRQAAVGVVVDGLVPYEGSEDVEHGDVDELAATGALAFLKRGDDAECGERGRGMVGDRRARAERRPVGEAGAGHEAGSGLHDVVHRGPIGVGPALAVAGDRRIHEAPVGARRDRRTPGRNRPSHPGGSSRRTRRRLRRARRSGGGRRSG